MKNSRGPIIAVLFIALSAGSAFPRMTDAEFLDMVSKDTFAYFMEQSNPDNGMVRDGSSEEKPSSIAAVGFALTALCIGVENKWIPKNEAYIRIVRTLRAFKNSVPNEHGFFYHFLDMETGQREWNSEVSSIDTALFIAGALTACEYFKGSEIDTLANEIYERVDWKWMLKGKKVLCMGYTPENGFLQYYWDSYNEAMILYALAIGSPTNPIPRSCWHAWSRNYGRYGKYNFIYCPTGSLFVYQYSHAWIDFRGKKDLYADYWENSVQATLANRQYCIDNAAKFPGFAQDVWGLTASIGPRGYKGYGGGPGSSYCDGTIAPSAAAGSMPFAPELCLEALRTMYDEYGSELYGKYGFKDSFNLKADWWCDEYLGIDQGISLLMIENYRSGFVWKYFMRHPAVQRWLSACFKTDNNESGNSADPQGE